MNLVSSVSTLSAQIDYFFVPMLFSNSFSKTWRTKLTQVYLHVLISISIEWTELMWAWSQIHCNLVFVWFCFSQIYGKKMRLVFLVYLHHSSGAGMRALLTRLRTSFVMLFVTLESSPTSVRRKQMENSIKFFLDTIAQVWNVTHSYATWWKSQWMNEWGYCVDNHFSPDAELLIVCSNSSSLAELFSANVAMNFLSSSWNHKITRIGLFPKTSSSRRINETATWTSFQNPS